MYFLQRFIIFSIKKFSFKRVQYDFLINDNSEKNIYGNLCATEIILKQWLKGCVYFEYKIFFTVINK